MICRHLASVIGFIDSPQIPQVSAENLADVREGRGAKLNALIQKLDALIQMSDAVLRNTLTPPGVKVLLASCMAHGRRQFADAAANLPESAGIRQRGRVLYMVSTLKRNSVGSRRKSASSYTRRTAHH